MASIDPWMTAMQRGDFQRAWQISDVHHAERTARGVPKHEGPRHLQHIWDGTALADKRVLVRCYHGLGDAVQFIRFAAPLRRVAREVIVWVQPALLPLIATAPGVDRVLPLHDGTPDAAYDCDIEIMELAHALRADEAMIACPVPYLFPGPGARRLAFGSELSVGLVWRAGEWAPERSIHGGLLAPLASVPGIRLFSLQCGPAAVEARNIPACDISCENVIETARTLQSLDLVITIDTFVAHLAGALGVPTWLMLNADCDWRWMRDRHDSVWYPTARLFRQPRAGDWTSVIRLICNALGDLASTGGRETKIPEQTISPDVRL